MRSYLIFASVLVLLTSCTWGGANKATISPYPSSPLGVSTEIGMKPTVITGGSYKAKGTEPFWAVDMTPGSATLSRPTASGTSTVSYTTTEDNKDAIVVIKGVKGDFFVNMTKGTCSDGMSDTVYTYNATVLVGALSLTGCALGVK